MLLPTRHYVSASLSLSLFETVSPSAREGEGETRNCERHRDTLPSLSRSSTLESRVRLYYISCSLLSEGGSGECKELWRRARRGGEFQTFETVFLAGGGGFTLNGSHEYFQHPLRSLSSLGRFDSSSFT